MTILTKAVTANEKYMLLETYSKQVTGIRFVHSLLSTISNHAE